MILINEYFDGNVKSLGYSSGEGKSTVGVIEEGEYEFGTSQHETMIVLEGVLNVLLPGRPEWQLYTSDESFEIEANKTFKVKASGQVSYLCKYK